MSMKHKKAVEENSFSPYLTTTQELGQSQRNGIAAKLQKDNVQLQYITMI